LPTPNSQLQKHFAPGGLRNNLQQDKNPKPNQGRLLIRTEKPCERDLREKTVIRAFRLRSLVGPCLLHNVTLSLFIGNKYHLWCNRRIKDISGQEYHSHPWPKQYWNRPVLDRTKPPVFPLTNEPIKIHLIDRHVQVRRLRPGPVNASMRPAQNGPLRLRLKCNLNLSDWNQGYLLGKLVWSYRNYAWHWFLASAIFFVDTPINFELVWYFDHWNVKSSTHVFW
jgi:hypothetical protein